MGYSAYVICRSAKSRDKMHKFLTDKVTPWHELVKVSEKLPRYKPEHDFTSNPVAGDDIAYGARKLAVGFNFSSQGHSGEYMWCLLRFAALRVGTERVIDGVKTRFTVYDGFEFYAVKDCGDDGFKGGGTYTYCWGTDAEIDRVVAAEMKRLGRLWPAGVLTELAEATR